MKPTPHETAGRRPISASLPVPVFKWRVSPEQRDFPLSRIVSDYLAIPEAEALALIDFGSVYAGGRVARDPQKRVPEGSEIVANIPRYGTKRFYELDPARILYRDRFLLAYDKEASIPSQQTPHDAYNNLYAALLRYLEKEGGRSPYAALHHRLDRETSGVILFALEKDVNRRLGDAFQSHRVRKDYLAWVEGRPAQTVWTADFDVGRGAGRYRTVPKGSGKPARTELRVLDGAGERALVLARPLTGRTHQIRLHLQASGHPVAGDRLYGAKPAERLYLHAFRLRLQHPAGKSQLAVTAPVPPGWPPPHDISLPDDGPD